MVVFTFLVVSAERSVERLGGNGRRWCKVALGVVVSTGAKRKDVALDIVARVRVPSACALI